jgi:anti-anti-sigma regulatory factor
VVLDMVDTEHLGGAGIRLLINLAKTLGRKGGGLVLCGLSDHLKKSFNLAGVSQQFVRAKSRDEAVQMLSAKEKVAELSNEAARLLATPGKKRGSADKGG